MSWYNMNSHNYNHFIIYFAKYFCPKNFKFTIDSLIKHKWILKIKNEFINNKNIFTCIKSIPRIKLKFET
jgi:hypothetical protein